jgi:hypothetical protein
MHTGTPGCSVYKEVSVDRNTATETQTIKWGQEGRKNGRKPKENGQKQRKPTETQGPCPNRKRFLYQSPYRTLIEGEYEDRPSFSKLIWYRFQPFSHIQTYVKPVQIILKPISPYVKPI